MIEKTYSFRDSDEKLIEKIVDDDNLAINHIVLTKGTGVPEHFSNSNVYLIIVRGTMTISLSDGEPREYTKGHIVNVPFNVKMNIKNLKDETMEFFVVKAPNPKDMVKK
jgi:quercetin dioxygenase-like cupin family protein